MEELDDGLRNTLQTLCKCGDHEYVGCMWTSKGYFVGAGNTREDILEMMDAKVKEQGIETIPGASWIWENTVDGVREIFEFATAQQESEASTLMDDDIECLRLLSELAWRFKLDSDI